MSVRRKIATGVLSLVGLMMVSGGITVTSFHRMNGAFKRAIESEKETQTKALVDLGYAVAVEQHGLEVAGKITRQEAQERTKSIIRTMRYDDSGYLWINDLQPAMVMHPMRTDLEGKDLSNYADPTGKKLFVEFVAVAKSKGAGFVPYMWPKPGQTTPVAKISYVKEFEPWGWVIGTGLYTDDVDAQASASWNSSIRQSKEAAFAISLLVVIIGLAFAYILRDVHRTLESVAGELAQGAEQVASAASHVSEASQALAQGATEQAASVEESSASAEEVSSISTKNAESSKVVASLMDAAATRVVEGDGRVAEMVETMRQISDSSNEISKIVKLIDEIAFQTNILALNAAIEAARAGSAGDGFGVVANEVRSLAQRCAQAAKDTSHLIDRSVENSHEGQQKSLKVTAAISAITSDVEQVKTLIHGITRESQDQANTIQQMKIAMDQVEQIAQRNAASAEESAAAGQQLQAQSETLRAAVARLNSLLGSQGTHATVN